jgi:hypothetical protein
MREAYHHGEVVEAICLACQGMAKLVLDTDGTEAIYVGSNRLFGIGATVELLDDDGASETGTVAELVGLGQVVLDAPVSGSFEVAHGARVGLLGASVPELSWVGHGRPALAPSAGPSRFPCVVVEPQRLVQPLRGGTNRSVTQSYWTSVYYIRRHSEGEEQERHVLEQVQLLFDLLMADPYLGGTCWHSQVSMVDCCPQAEAVLRERGAGVRVVKLDVVAQRSESVV